MFNKQFLSVILLTVFSLLSACAKHLVQDSHPSSDSAASTGSSEQEPKNLVPEVSQKVTLLETVLECMKTVDSLQPSELAAEIDRLQSKMALTQAIPGQAYSDTLIERFSLACLLGRETASVREWDRAEVILAELAKAFEHEEERQLVRYVERSLGLQRSLRRHQSQLNRLRQQNTELQNKIEQLKGLERDLDVNNPYSGEFD